MKTRIRTSIGELVVALYDGAASMTRDKRLQELLVGLALLDLRTKAAKNSAKGSQKARKGSLKLPLFFARR